MSTLCVNRCGKEALRDYRRKNTTVRVSACSEQCAKQFLAKPIGAPIGFVPSVEMQLNALTVIGSMRSRIEQLRVRVANAAELPPDSNELVPMFNELATQVYALEALIKPTNPQAVNAALERPSVLQLIDNLLDEFTNLTHALVYAPATTDFAALAERLEGVSKRMDAMANLPLFEGLRSNPGSRMAALPLDVVEMVRRMSSSMVIKLETESAVSNLLVLSEELLTSSIYRPLAAYGDLVAWLNFGEDGNLTIISIPLGKAISYSFDVKVFRVVATVDPIDRTLLVLFVPLPHVLVTGVVRTAFLQRYNIYGERGSVIEMFVTHPAWEVISDTTDMAIDPRNGNIVMSCSTHAPGFVVLHKNTGALIGPTTNTRQSRAHDRAPVAVSFIDGSIVTSGTFPPVGIVHPPKPFTVFSQDGSTKLVFNRKDMSPKVTIESMLLDGLDHLFVYKSDTRINFGRTSRVLDVYDLTKGEHLADHVIEAEKSFATRGVVLGIDNESHLRIFNQQAVFVNKKE